MFRQSVQSLRSIIPTKKYHKGILSPSNIWFANSTLSTSTSNSLIKYKCTNHSFLGDNFSCNENKSNLIGSKRFMSSSSSDNEDDEILNSPRETMPFDVLIVGGGPAGLAASIRLKQLCLEKDLDLSVCVIEKGK